MADTHWTDAITTAPRELAGGVKGPGKEGLGILCCHRFLKETRRDDPKSPGRSQEAKPAPFLPQRSVAGAESQPFSGPRSTSEALDSVIPTLWHFVTWTQAGSGLRAVPKTWIQPFARPVSSPGVSFAH